MGNQMNCCKACKDEQSINFDDKINQKKENVVDDDEEMENFERLLENKTGKVKGKNKEKESIGNGHPEEEEKDKTPFSHSDSEYEIRLKEKNEDFSDKESRKAENEKILNYTKEEKVFEAVSLYDRTRISKLKIFKKLVLNKNKILNEKNSTVIIQGKLKKHFVSGIKGIRNTKEIYMVINKEVIRIFKSKESFIEIGKPIQSIPINDLIKIRLEKDKEEIFVLEYINQNTTTVKEEIELSGIENGQMEEFISVLYFLLFYYLYPQQYSQLN